MIHLFSNHCNLIFQVISPIYISDEGTAIPPEQQQQHHHQQLHSQQQQQHEIDPDFDYENLDENKEQGCQSNFNSDGTIDSGTKIHETSLKIFLLFCKVVNTS